MAARPKIDRVQSVFDDCIIRNKANKIVEPDERKQDDAQRAYMEKLMALENQGSRKRVFKPTVYPLPEGMSRSVYRTDFEKFRKKDLLEGRARMHNMEIDAQEIFTKLMSKNGFKQESVTSTAATLNVIAEQLGKMKAHKEKLKERRNQGEQVSETSEGQVQNIYERTIPTIKQYVLDNREL